MILRLNLIELSETEGGETGDGFIPSLSERAMEAMPRAAYWKTLNSEAIIRNVGKEYEEAFLTVQTELEAILVADKANPFTKSRYVSLGYLLAIVKPALNKNGFTLRQFSARMTSHGQEPKRWFAIPVCSMLTHVNSGQFELVVLELPVEKTTIWGVTAAVTSGRRCGLQSLLGLATVDDDGAAAIHARLEGTETEDAITSTLEALKAVSSVQALKKWTDEHQDAIALLGTDAVLRIRQAYDEKRNELKAVKDKK